MQQEKQMKAVSIPESNFILYQPDYLQAVTSDTAFLVESVIRQFKSDSEMNVLDAGTGTGIIAFMLKKHFNKWQITGIDIQKSAIDLAVNNQNLYLQHYPMQPIDFIHQDLRSYERQDFDLILCNPPYYKLNQARLTSNPEKALARHEITLTMEDILFYFTKQKSHSARLFILYPDFRDQELINNTNKMNLKIYTQNAVPNSRANNQVFLYEIGKC